MRRLESGQSVTEYALILVLVAVVCIGVLLLMGGQIKAIFTNIAGALKSARG
jgi:pilus assembly protein Flp/PilA